jgi:hypothetical protein
MMSLKWQGPRKRPESSKSNESVKLRPYFAKEAKDIEILVRLDGDFRELPKDGFLHSVTAQVIPYGLPAEQEEWPITMEPEGTEC